MVIASYLPLGFATFKGMKMPRKPDALDSAKITSNGSAIEMQDIIAIPSRRGRKKKEEQQSATTEPQQIVVVSPSPVVAAPSAPAAPAKKIDSYVVVADAKAWINGQLIHFQTGKVVNEILFGPKFLARLQDQGVQLKKTEE